MRILVINGSPRGKGNTYNVVKEFEEYANKNNDLNFEYIFLNRAKLFLCKGCHQCIFNGEKHCPLKDDRAKIESKILSSDAVIIATPSYVMSVPAVLKNFIDRIAYNFHRPKYFKQKLFLIATSSDYATKATLGYLKILNGAGFHLIGTLGIFPEMFPFTEKAKSRNKMKIEKAAAGFYKKLKSKETPKITFGDLLQLRVMRSINSLIRNIFSADYEYYIKKGWFDKNTKYYTDARVNPFKVFFADILEKIIKKSISKMIDKDKLNELSGKRKK